MNRTKKKGRNENDNSAFNSSLVEKKRDLLNVQLIQTTFTKRMNETWEQFITLHQLPTAYLQSSINCQISSSSTSPVCACGFSLLWSTVWGTSLSIRSTVCDCTPSFSNLLAVCVCEPSLSIDLFLWSILWSSSAMCRFLQSAASAFVVTLTSSSVKGACVLWPGGVGREETAPWWSNWRSL